MNLADSKEAINKVCERFHRAYDEILGCLTKHIFENEDTAYNNICRGIRLLIYHRSKNATDGLRIKDEAFDVMIENNLPAPLKECWVENNLYDFEYYITNVFWPKVIDKFLRRPPVMPSVESAQDMIKDETAWDVIIDKRILTCLICHNPSPKFKSKVQVGLKSKSKVHVKYKL